MGDPGSLSMRNRTGQSKRYPQQSSFRQSWIRPRRTRTGTGPVAVPSRRSNSSCAVGSRTRRRVAAERIDQRTTGAGIDDKRHRNGHSRPTALDVQNRSASERHHSERVDLIRHEVFESDLSGMLATRLAWRHFERLGIRDLDPVSSCSSPKPWKARRPKGRPTLQRPHGFRQPERRGPHSYRGSLPRARPGKSLRDSPVPSCAA